MKICIVIGGLLETGGIQTMVSDLAGELVRQGHVVRIICMGQERDVPEGVIVDTITGRPYTLAVYRRIKTLARAGEVDVVHAVGCAGINVLFNKLFDNMPFLLTYASTAISEYRVGARTFSELRRHAKFFVEEFVPGHFADGITCISNYTRGAVAANYLIKKERMKVIYIGVDPGRFKNDGTAYKNGRRVLLIGRIDPRKGYLEFVEQAAPGILASYPDVEINIVGKRFDTYTSYNNRLDNAIGAPELSGRVKLCGEVSHDELLAYYSTSDLFIQASKEEGFGIALIEAQSCGLPVVAFNTSAIRETVCNEKSGFIVNSYEEMVQNVNRLLSDSKLRTAMGANAVQFVKNFSWETIAQQYVKEYKSIARNKAR